jgi:EpsD family peptidyl-prolyl cis-trans isomerase
MVKNMRGALVVLAVFALAACGAKKEEAAKATTSQVVAQVNKEEITVSQLNYALSRLGGIRQDELLKVKKEVLDRLIEQDVLVQAAVTQKLDRETAVQQQLEAARREILSRAMAEKIANSVAKPNEQEVAAFYNENPDLFSKRRVYKFDEINIPIGVASRKDIATMLDAAKSLAAVGDGLRANKMDAPISANVTRPAEELPIDLVPKLAKFKDGEVFRYNRGQVQVVAKLVSSREVPVELEKAKPLIDRVLHTRKKTEVLPVEVKRLKDAAKIAYLGEFTPEGFKAAQEAEAAKAAAATIPVKPPAAETEKTAIEKGLKGLK